MKFPPTFSIREHDNKSIPGAFFKSLDLENFPSSISDMRYDWGGERETGQNFNIGVLEIFAQWQSTTKHKRVSLLCRNNSLLKNENLVTYFISTFLGGTLYVGALHMLLIWEVDQRVFKISKRPTGICLQLKIVYYRSRLL